MVGLLVRVLWASLVIQKERICLPVQEMWVRSLGQEDPLEKEMATHSSILAWRLPRTERPGGLQSMGSQRVRHDCATKYALAVWTGITGDRIDRHLQP